MFIIENGSVRNINGNLRLQKKSENYNYSVNTSISLLIYRLQLWRDTKHFKVRKQSQEYYQ